MGLLIHDGYTMDFEVKGNAQFPAVRGRYRPALPDIMNEWRLQNAKATTGKEVTTALARVLEKCLVSWDVMDKASVLSSVLGKKIEGGDDLVTVPIVEATLRAIPDDLLNRIFRAVISYGPEQQEADVKNS